MNPRKYQTAGFKRARAAGYRSPFEVAVMKHLDEAGVEYEYEKYKINYTVPERRTYYKPDLVLRNGIIVEVKGEWTTEDRKKHKLIHEQFPDLDIRLLFSNSRKKIGSTSQTSYSLYCDRLGIPWAHRTIPQAWLDEPPTAARTRALKALVAI